jgi:exodeoxyribonuclease VII small subunit
MSTPSNPSEPLSFEQALERLSAIVHDLEDGQVGLSESLVKYEEGVGLLRQCYELLQKAERRIELLTRLDTSGAPITTPFDDSPTSVDAGQDGASSAGRSRRRATKSVSPETASNQVSDCSDDTDAPGVPGGLF